MTLENKKGGDMVAPNNHHRQGLNKSHKNSEVVKNYVFDEKTDDIATSLIWLTVLFILWMLINFTLIKSEFVRGLLLP